MYHRFLAHGNRDWTEDHEERDLTFGLRGKLQSGIDYDVSVRSYRREETQVGNTFVSEKLAIAAIEAGDYDLTNPLSTDPDHLAAVRRMAVTLDREEVMDIVAAEGVVSGVGFLLPGGNLQWMAGVGLDRVKAHDISKHRDSTGTLHPVELVLGSGGVSYEGERSRRSGFAEVQLPALPGWTVSLAARLDDYDDVGTTNAWQAASAWRVNKMFTLHGSWERGADPPSLSSLHATERVTYPYVCDTRTHSGPLAECNTIQVKTLQHSNSALQPDESQAWSLGGIADLGFLSLAADWFHLEVSDQPGRLHPQSIVDMDAESRTLPTGAAVRREGDAITEIHNPLVNTGEVNVSGFNIRAHTDWEVGDADAGIDLRWIYVTEHKVKVGGVEQPGDFPHHRVHATFHVSQGDLTAAWHTRGISGYENVLGSGTFDPWIGHDVILQWRSAFSLEGLVLQAGVLNLTDSGPSVDSSNPLSADIRRDSVRGRTFFLKTGMSF